MVCRLKVWVVLLSLLQGVWRENPTEMVILQHSAISSSNSTTAEQKRASVAVKYNNDLKLRSIYYWASTFFSCFNHDIVPTNQYKSGGLFPKIIHTYIQTLTTNLRP